MICRQHTAWLPLNPPGECTIHKSVVSAAQTDKACGVTWLAIRKDKLMSCFLFGFGFGLGFCWFGVLSVPGSPGREEKRALWRWGTGLGRQGCFDELGGFQDHTGLDASVTWRGEEETELSGDSGLQSSQAWALFVMHVEMNCLVRAIG